jgi:type IV pilus assembly protein PilB
VAISPVVSNDLRGHYSNGDHRVPRGQHLVAAGLATSEEVDRGLEEQRHTGQRLGELLVARGVLFEADLARVVASMSDLPYRDLGLQVPDPSVLSRIPEAFCRNRLVLPVAFEHLTLSVAIADPSDIQTLDDLKLIVATEVQPVVVARDQLRQAIETAFQGNSLLAESQRSAATRAGDRGYEMPDAEVAVDLNPPQDEGPVVRLVNQLLRRAIDERASDLHVESTEEGLRIRFRVDGLLHDVMNAPASLRLELLSRVKIMTGMDITEHRRPQDGRASMVAAGIAVDIRAATMPTLYGESMVLRLLRQDQGLLDVDALGFLPDSLSRYRKSFLRPWGMVLVTGPTGSGKSTTLNATVNELNVPTRNTITVEDPIEYRIAGIKQTQVNATAGYTFASGLRSALRSDPDVS